MSNQNFLNKRKNTNSSIPNENLIEKKDTLRCFFCGGKNCKNEDYTKHETGFPYIIGLNSDLVDENIIASQRPSNTLIEKYNIIKQFKEKNIGLIINLQIPGEHANCGPNELDKDCGFSYSISKFKIHNIHVEACGWIDMGIPDSYNFILKIVKKMFYYIKKKKKKVLVHCHSGFGRTGLVIACYKIFSESVNADFAIKEIRKKRRKCVQNKKQYEFCEKFYYFVQRKKGIFMEKKDIDVFISDQKDLDTNNYKFDNFIYDSYVPLILQYAFDAILNIKKKNNISVSSIFKCLNGNMKINKKIDNYLEPIIESINNGNWKIFKSCDDIIIIIELIYLWLGECVKFCIDPIELSNLGNDLYNKSFADYEIKIINLITNFINICLIDDKKNNKNTNEMIGKISIYLLGYTIESLKKEKNNKEMEKNVEKLFNKINELILYYESNENNFLYKKIQENKNEQNENKKEEIIKSIFNHYFKDKISEKKQKNIFDSINKIINGNKDNESINSKSKNINNDNDKPFMVNKIGSILLKINNEFPSSNDSTNLRSIKTLKLGFINQPKEENKEEEKKEEEKEEEEKGKKIPWIKEEDC